MAPKKIGAVSTQVVGGAAESEAPSPPTEPRYRTSKRDLSSQDDPNVVQYSEMAVRNNVSVLEYSRTCQSAASGCAAGIIGLTGWQGFVFYFVCVLVQSVVWYGKAAADWKAYFLDSSLLVSHSILSGLFTYILFWVFLYGMVHVY